MAPMLDDPRKLFLLTTVGNYFSVKTSPALATCTQINNFLDDANEFLLAASTDGDELRFSNRMDSGQCEKRVLVFFKLRPCVITEENISSMVLVSSMLESPISTLYQSIRTVFNPALHQDEKWSQAFDPRLQSLLSELEAGLGSALRHTHPKNSGKKTLSEDDVLGMVTPCDEFQYWAEVSRSAERSSARERAMHFSQLFKPIEKDYSSLDSASLTEALELIEHTRDVLDDVWKQNEHTPYSETRMRRLMDVTGFSLARFVQKKLCVLRLWEEPYSSVRESLKTGVAVCEQWVAACEHLSSQVWKRYSPHPWSGEKHRPLGLHDLTHRLQEVLQLRTVQEKLQRLVFGAQQQQISASIVFEPFTGLNPVLYNPYTEPLWRAAVSQFERLIAPAEQEVAGRLKAFIRDVQDSPQQLLLVFQKHRDLIKRPTVSKELQPERETLLTRLLDYCRGLRADFDGRCHGVPGEKTGPLAGRNLPEVVNNIVWVRQLLMKVEDSLKMAEALLSDLPGFRAFVQFSDEVLEQLRSYEQEQFDDWTRDLISGLSDPKSGISLQASNRVMELDHVDGKLKVQYSERLVSLVKEVRQLSALGFTVPAKIIQAATVAERFHRQALVLKQVAHFYNTIDQQMIPSQKPMMLNYALAFEQVIKQSPRAETRDGGGKLQITWENPKELEIYINKLQNAAERLSAQNRKLRKWHTDFTDKVVMLMSVDLLRQQQRWKEGLQELRAGFATIESQGVRVSDMHAWRQHWNHQLYKALEFQYQCGLQALNKNLPEIHIDLVFKHGRVQFRPVCEELRVRYYRELKRFISIPNQFRGVYESDKGAEPIFTAMIDNNSRAFITIYSNAEQLFSRLQQVQDRFREWVVLGQVDMEVLVEKHLLTVQDWERNFRALKAKGKEVERLPSVEKVDCFTVNCEPVKAAIDDLIQKLFDTMLTALRKSIQGHIQAVDSFVNSGMAALSTRPESIEEIGEANSKHSQLQAQKPEVLPQFQQMEEKNRLLRSVAGGGVDSISSLRAKWDKFELMMESHQLMIREQVEVMKNSVSGRVSVYLQELQKFRSRWDQLRPADDVIESCDPDALQRCVERVREKREEFNELENTRTKLLEDCEHFGLDVPDMSLALDTLHDLQRCSDMWSLYEEFQNTLNTSAQQDWITFRSRTHEFEEFVFMWHDRLRKQEEHNTMTVMLQKEVDKYKTLLPVLKYVRGDHLSQDHWLDLFRLLGLPKGTTLERLLFRDLLTVSHTIIDKALELKDLNSRAHAEVSIREALREVELWAAGASFSLTEYTNSTSAHISLIREWRDVMNQVGDNRCLLQSLKDSPYYQRFHDKVSLWETRLADLDDFLQSLNSIQRKWLYLEPIFGRGALPREQARFHRVDQDFRAIMSDVQRDSRVTSLTTRAGMRNSLNTLQDQLQRCQKSLNDFLEEKRSAFPRFYFIGDDDLLEILGQATNPTVIQTHLKKLFAGIHSVDFDSSCSRITAMKSLEGETVPLRNTITISNDVEVWLSELSSEMKETLQFLLCECVKAVKGGGVDPNRFPSQILCLAEQIQFTEDVESAIREQNLHQLELELTAKLEHYTDTNARIESADSSVLQLKLKALILDVIHNLSVVRELLEVHVHSADDWVWKKQLRFYLNTDQRCTVHMVDAAFNYTYEYQGNAPKLVHTPLTDKCYLTLTQAMRMGLGGNPYGPAGTGKTESVKALGGLLGRQVLVFNCDEGIDVKSMGRIFVGLIKCGAWGCFDEFNRLEEAVLSAVSMQIQAIQDSLRQHRDTCHLLGKEVELDPNSGVFITLNPAGKGYGGRQKLPDNLKQLFRPVAMTTPDNELIAEVILYSEGFKQGKELARKLTAVFNLARELLTPQQHYDWGLRALKTVLKGCGNLLQLQRKQHTEVSESVLVVQALRLNTLSKLTFSDSARFDALLRDVFPAVDFNEVHYEELKNALLGAYEEAQLEIIPSQVRKALELYEQMRQRMGVVMVGPSGCGKSTVWRLLRAALKRLGLTVQHHTVNPKALSRQQLLGHMDMDTREWSDGVITAASRHVIREPQEVSSWIVCDGDIDPEWVESLNSVLDDNRLLTMPSGERIQFGPNVNFLFETHDLSCASPATISRMGIIFLSDEDTDVSALLKAWLRREQVENRDNLEIWINEYFQRALNWVFTQGECVVETSLVGAVLNGLSHLRGVSERGEFIVGLIRGLGGNLQLKSRQEFAKQVLSWAGEIPPDPRNPLDLYYDRDSGRVCVYELQRGDGVRVEDLSNTHTLPVIHTPRTQHALHNFTHWLQSGHTQPFLLVGPEGCGKGMLLRYAFSRLRSTQVAVVHCSAQTTSRHVLQKLTHTCVCISSNTHRVYRPRDCERLVLHLKDINLPKPDKWGTSNLIAFLQQVLTYQGFYDESLEWVGLENIQIVCSMSVGGAVGRHTLTSRFTSIVRICTIDYPDREQLQTIYSAYLSPVLQRTLGNHPTWSSVGKIHQLAGSLVQIYEQVKAKFTVDDHSHYLFTPCVLTQWVLNLLRYDLTAGKCVTPTDSVLEVVVYEAHRLFRDKLVSDKDLHAFDNILSSVIRGDWGSDVLDNVSDTFFVTWGASHDGRGHDKPLPLYGKPLGRLNSSDLTEVIRKGVLQYERENRELDLLIFPEVLDFVCRVDRVLSAPAGCVLLAGRSGVGRRTAVCLVTHMHRATLHTPRISRSYTLKHFRNDLKTVMQMAGVEGQQTVLLLEDHQFVHPSFLEMVNSLLSSGEVPGLYSTEELEPLLSSLKDQAAQDGFTGPLFNYYTHRVQQNLHVVLIMDCTNENFTINCESNPALYRKCSVQWLEGWRDSSMKKIPEMFLSEMEEEKSSEKKTKKHKTDFFHSFLMIHKSCRDYGATPNRYLSFLKVYQSIYSTKKRELTQRQQHLQAGVAKLNEAKSLVDELKRRAAEQSMLLKTKQAEADAALQEITTSMQNASDQKTEMEKLKGRMAQEVAKIEERKEKIDDELKEVQPLVEEAKQAVGNIKPESLSEIRSLRMPPDVIRDILEGVLRLMGIFDTSWVSMKSFLAKRGVREDIVTFDARNITHEIRESVEELLHRNRASFDPKNAKRASAAAAPLAAWVKANVQYSHVLEKIQPLETEQAGLMENLRKTESRMSKLEAQLNSVGERVSELKDKFQCRTTEAAKLEADVSRAQETISAAEKLIHQLDGEHTRWSTQVDEISEELKTLPKRVQLAAAFITYLSATPEDQRRATLHSWMEHAELQKFDLRHFLCSESEQLIWKSEGLPSDDLSMENALVILQSVACPFLIDPSSRATEWLRTHLKAQRLEVINQQDSNFMTSLELAVRFGKTLIIQEVDGVEPVLYPLLRRDLIAQGPRYVVQIGEKVVDYNEDFRLFLATRNPSPFIPPDAASIITEVNFTTTRAGLRGQLLALTIQHEKPELEREKTRLLQQEEEKKIQLALLEDSLLQTLATAQGNILENKELIESLNQTKASSALIHTSLTESHRLQASLDQERDAYLPLAESASKMYFVITDLSRVNSMYRFSLASFIRIFHRALQTQQESDSTEARIAALEMSLKSMVYEYVCRSLFKVDQLMFALHFVKGTQPELFQENEWDALIGLIVADTIRKTDSQKSLQEHIPSWIDQERHTAVALLKSTFPALYQSLCLGDADLWLSFSQSSVCEQEIPSSIAKKISLFQQVLVVQALRPDRLQSAMANFASHTLGMKELSPPPLNLRRLYGETVETEPVLIIISPGADPSQELQELANHTVGLERYHEVAMGQGQADVALQVLRECVCNGEWLCLKNLHLVTQWLPLLEKELNSMQPKAGFRLWLTAEVHPNFTPILLQSSLKITYEAPPGLKKNLLRTYESWSSEQISKGGNIARAQSLFCLAWFHAVCQERRNYIPQGWTKFYEFSLSDLRAGFDIIDRLFEGGKMFQWDCVHGLLESAIYGGRVDNVCDLRVLRSYLHQFFSNETLTHSRTRATSAFPPQINLPNSCGIADYQRVVDSLPEDDKPSFFGLPANIERSAQRITSTQVISQLRILSRSVTAGSKFDRELWASGLSPVLNLWKRLNQGSSLIQQKLAPPTEGAGSPVLSFVLLEQFNAVRLVQSIHQSLASLSKVIRGTCLLTADTHKLATALLNQECPLGWQSKWEGPDDPMQYLRAVVSRALAVQNWVERVERNTLLSDTLDLSDLFHPHTFLNALRQETARSMSCSMDSLKFVASWKSLIAGAKLQVKVGGLQLEGCSFDGNRLSENHHNSPSVCAVPTCYMAWILQNSPGCYSPEECVLLPVYASAERVCVVTHIDVPCGGNQEQWIQSGAALFLKQQNYEKREKRQEKRH
ncbi:cytoplasmic dynein 2 heavy chain 1 isoform X3 [Pangasianodon hypophthalmus]|uniref:cytoplasmic dynein 2 heavy chain 1 isoform X3 n=2 Tax=Pangasianodon hypophthalmus TaxID=310915 RepID=UPI00230714C5|nr:cytoplasmic dynein 2 heavy chain 1 isoform X3 [Pangasianodon hypophthalmus]